MINIAFAESSAAKVGVNIGTIDAILHASAVVQITLGILLILSVYCWAIGITKFFQFQDLTNANIDFLAKFYKGRMSLAILNDETKKTTLSSCARVFKAGYNEFLKLSDLSDQTDGKINKLYGIENIERALRKAIDLEISAMESRLTLLATTGSTGPFIGLFGTVWGIMGSFQKIGATGSASLAIVAPGISEALITTAIGLAAAIPAVVLYNNFVSKIKKEEIALNSFSNDFLNLIKRNYYKE